MWSPLTQLTPRKAGLSFHETGTLRPGRSPVWDTKPGQQSQCRHSDPLDPKSSVPSPRILSSPLYRWGPLRLQDEPYAKRRSGYKAGSVGPGQRYAPTTRYPTFAKGRLPEGRVFTARGGTVCRLSCGTPESRPGRPKGAPGGSMGPGRQSLRAKGPQLTLGAERNSLCPRKEDEPSE